MLLVANIKCIFVPKKNLKVYLYLRPNIKGVFEPFPILLLFNTYLTLLLINVSSLY